MRKKKTTIADLTIDRYNLDEALVRQPQLYFEWAIKAVIANDTTEVMKLDLNILKSNIERKIRKNPERYNINNPTEAAIKAAVQIHPKVVKYSRRIIEANKDEKILAEARKAFDHRKKMLEALVNLNIQLHFAEPKVPKLKEDQIYKYKKNKQREGLKGSIKSKRKIKRRKI